MAAADVLPPFSPEDDGQIEARIRRIFADSPHTNALGIRFHACGPGWCRSTAAIAPAHLQHSGVVHAGVLATMADQTAGAAASTTASLETNPLTIEFKINLLRPAAGEKLVCLARVLKAGRRITVVHSEVYAYIGETEKNVATATVTIANV